MARNPQYYNEHDASNFPFEDGAILRNAAGDVLPPGVFLDAVFYPPVEANSLFLSRVSIGGDFAEIFLSTEDVAGVASGRFELFDPPTLIEFYTPTGATAGVIVSDAIRLSVFQSWAVGEHVFEAGEAPFVAACQLPVAETPAGVTGLVAGGESSAKPLWLIGHSGVVLAVESRTVVENGTPQSVTVIEVNAVGDPNFLQKLCSPDLYTAPKFIKRIVFQQGQRQHVALPNGRGDVQVTGSQLATPDTILRVTPTERGVSIRTVGQLLGQ